MWYDGVPPGRQPRPTDCYEAERIASRDQNARVIYGGGSRQNAPIYRDDRRYPDDIYRDGDVYGGTDGRRPNSTGNRTGRAVPRGEQYESEYRRGFLAAYESVHDGRQRSGSGWWPF